MLTLCGAAQAEPSSCAQQEFTQELPLSPIDPRIIIGADTTQLEQNGLSTLSGSVHIAKDGRELAADKVHYDDVNRTVYIDSESLFRYGNVIIVKSQNAQYDLNTDHGIFNEAQFSLPQMASRGSSKQVTLDKRNTAELTDARYTGCAPGHEAWVLEASHIRLDNQEGMGSAKNATLRFGGVPIFWAPYFRFPIDNQRRSGLLVPTFGDLSNTGLDFRAPVYLNLAPNYDATLTPRYMSKRGLQMQGDFRYLFAHADGKLHGEYLGQDQDTGVQRDYIDYSQDTRINHRLGFEAHYANVSDPSYFSDLGGTYDAVSTPYLERDAQLTYQAPTQYTVRLLAQDFEPLAGLTQAQNPYQRMPALLVDGHTKNRFYGVGAGFDGDFSNFSRAESIEGQRLYADPYLRWEADHVGWFAAAQSDLTYTAYSLSGPLDGNPNDPRRTLPLYSLDSGLRFERTTGSGLLQTLEPRLYYLYVPYRNQNALPVFDTGRPDFDFPQLFANNRYSGEDRISDANQLTTALSTRLLDPYRGQPLLTATIGQIYRFEAPRVTLPGEDAPDRGTSDYIGDVDYAISAHWTLASAVQWSPDSGQFNRGEVGVHYAGEQSQLDVAYRYRRGLLEQTDTSFVVPVNDRWKLAARVRYSVQDDRLLDSFAGVEYQTCCWALRTTYRRYLASADGHFNDGVFFQLELKGLTRIGTSYESLLPAEDLPVSRRR